MAFGSWAYGIVYLIILDLGVLMLFIRGGFYSQGVALLIFIVLYLLVLSSGPEAYSRFRLPIMPALCVMAAAGLIHYSKATRPLWNSLRNGVED
jgi:hypothetical protein